MAKITIHRQKLIGAQGSDFIVYLDKNKIGKVKNGKILSFDLLPGKHNLQIKLDFPRFACSPTIDFSVNESEEIKYFTKFTRFSKLSFLIYIISH
jgi:hypothetical protein